MLSVTLWILIITGVVTVAAFARPELRERLLFNPYEILRRNEYERLVTCALIHANWVHFAFNAFSLYSFGQVIEQSYGWKVLLFIYLSSVLGGSLLSLIIHRQHEYRSLGASGGVCGVIFASIFLLPGGSISLFMLPVGIPSYVYAIGFLVYSFVASRRRQDNIGHDAHLGGAIVGLLLAAVLEPSLVFAVPWKFYTALGLSLAILAFFIFDPAHLFETRFTAKTDSPGGPRAPEYDEKEELNQKKAEMDRLLEKVSRFGINRLTTYERKRLEELSKEIYGAK